MWLALIALIVGIGESGAAYLLLRIGESKAQFLLWKPDFDEISRRWTAAAGQWDDEIGWPAPQEAVAAPRDRTGAKKNLQFPVSGQDCASAYGDSFVWGDDVPLEDGWIEQLSRELNCRVANFGVSGFGSDQAFVRFRRNMSDRAPVTMLGIFPLNAVRNVNQYRALIGFAQDPRLLKGRYILDGAEKLRWIPRPRLDGHGFVELHRNPGKVLPHEYLLPDSRDGPVSVAFPYSLSVLRILAMPRLRSRFSGNPSWAEFFEKDHPSGALTLTIAIAEAFVREAERRGKRGLVVMLPGASSFRAHEKHGSFEYAPLVQGLEARKVDVFDPAPALLARLGARRICELYVQPEDCEGHYGVAGGRLVAEVVGKELRRRRWVD